MAKLTPKQQRFCDEYIISLNATDAAIKAGYSKKTASVIGYENLNKPYISSYIEERLKEKEDELIAKQDEVLKYLTAVMRREKTESVVVTVAKEVSKPLQGDDGVWRQTRVKEEKTEVVEIPARLADANKAAELLGKRYKLFTDKVEVDGDVPVTFIDDLEE